jgi:hypothetical protein
VLVTLVLAGLLAVAVGLVLMFVGRVLKTGGKAPLLAAAGGFLTDYGWVIGLLVGILFFVTGGDWRP